MSTELTPRPSRIDAVLLPISAMACVALGVMAPYCSGIDLIDPKQHRAGAFALALIVAVVASSLTPPVAIAAPIAGANPLMTAFMSFRIGMAKFIIPFIFAFHPTNLIIEKFSLLPFIWIVERTCCCIRLFSSALSAYDARKLTIPEVFLRFVVAFAMLAITPMIHLPAVVIGIALIVIGLSGRAREGKA